MSWTRMTQWETRSSWSLWIIFYVRMDTELLKTSQIYTPHPSAFRDDRWADVLIFHHRSNFDDLSFLPYLRLMNPFPSYRHFQSSSISDLIKTESTFIKLIDFELSSVVFPWRNEKIIRRLTFNTIYYRKFSFLTPSYRSKIIWRTILDSIKIIKIILIHYPNYFFVQNLFIERKKIQLMTQTQRIRQSKNKFSKIISVPYSQYSKKITIRSEMILFLNFIDNSSIDKSVVKTSILSYFWFFSLLYFFFKKNYNL